MLLKATLIQVKKEYKSREYTVFRSWFRPIIYEIHTIGYRFFGRSLSEIVLDKFYKCSSYENNNRVRWSICITHKSSMDPWLQSFDKFQEFWKLNPIINSCLISRNPISIEPELTRHMSTLPFSSDIFLAHFAALFLACLLLHDSKKTCNHHVLLGQLFVNNFLIMAAIRKSIFCILFSILRQKS